MSEAQELLDLVDDQDRFVRRVTRGEVQEQGLKYIRGCEALLVNKRGELWVPIRADHKKWPGGYDFSMGEHVQAGESYKQALRRGLAEELGIDAAGVTPRLIGKVGPDDGRATFGELYEVEFEGEPEFDRSELTSGEWMTAAELLRRLEAGAPHKPDLLPTLKRFYS